MDKKMIELEKQAAFQEHMIAELNSELIEQQKRIAALERQVRILVEHSRSGGALVKDLKDEVPPPHY